MLNNPLTVLDSANQGKNILDNYTLKVSANIADGNGGSGTVSIGFLQGTSVSQNASVRNFDNTFWIETVQYQIEVPVSKAGENLFIKPSEPSPGSPVPTFLVVPPSDINQPTTISVTSTEIQYFQKVNLFFTGVNWPHISVGTLVPEAPIEVPASAF